MFLFGFVQKFTCYQIKKKKMAVIVVHHKFSTKVYKYNLTLEV